MTSNVLRGAYRGKFYPRDFTPEEMQIVETCYDENSYIFDSQSHYRNPYGIECISGRLGFYLEFDGVLFNCHFARQRLGSVYDDKLMVRSENCFCTAQKCESQTTIGWQADVHRRFQVQRTLHHYVKVADTLFLTGQGSCHSAERSTFTVVIAATGSFADRHEQPAPVKVSQQIVIGLARSDTAPAELCLPIKARCAHANRRFVRRWSSCCTHLGDQICAQIPAHISVRCENDEKRSQVDGDADDQHCAN